jgi:hypothetical protein
VSWIRYVTEAPDASVTRGHASEFRQRTVACGEAETNEAPHGITKPTPTSVAVAGPAFVTVRVYVSGAPGATLAGPRSRTLTSATPFAGGAGGGATVAALMTAADAVPGGCSARCTVTLKAPGAAYVCDPATANAPGPPATMVPATGAPPSPQSIVAEKSETALPV